MSRSYKGENRVTVNALTHRLMLRDTSCEQPLLSFYKYLQPISANGRSLRLNLPSTLVCERQDGHEETIWLRTDSHGNVTKESKTPSWRKKLFQELIASASGDDSDEAKSPESVHDGAVIAVRTITHWKSASSNKSIVLTKRTFDSIVNPPSELSFCIQQYVRCRGSHASIYRVMWSERANKCCAVNITNEYATFCSNMQSISMI